MGKLAEEAHAVRAEVLNLLGSFRSEAAGAREPDRQLDLYVAATFCLLIFVANWGVRIFIVKPLGRRLLGAPSHGRVSRAFDAKVEKFSQAMMEFWLYGSFSALGCYIVPRQPWIWPSRHWWIGFSSVLESITGLGGPGISSNPSTLLKSNSFSMILEPLILASRVLDD